MINCVVQRFCLLILLFSSFIVTAETIQIPLSGTGEVPSTTDMVVNPALLENGEVEVGAQRVKEFAISHTGGADAAAIEIWSIEVGGMIRTTSHLTTLVTTFWKLARQSILASRLVQ